MIRHLQGIAAAMLVGSCLGSASVPPSIDGMWSAHSDALGSTLSIVLGGKGGVLAGTGAYSTGAIRTGAIVVTGRYEPPIVSLQLTYDHGEVLTFTGRVVDADHMNGRLMSRAGSVVDIAFVRP